MSENQAKNIEELMEKLSGGDDETREEAASCLVGVVDKRLVPLLVEKMTTDPNPGVKHFAKKALGIIQKELGDLKAILAEAREEAARAAAGETPPAEAEPQNIEAAEKIKPEPVPQTLVVPEAAAPVTPAPPAAGPRKAAKNVGVSGADPAEQAEIARIVERLKANDRSALAGFIERIAVEKSPYILATLISAIGKLGDGSAMDSLLPFLAHGDHRVVANCVEALERLGDSRCVDYLGGLLTHPDGRVRSNSVKAIWKFTDKSLAINQGAFDRIRDLVSSENREMRESAIYILSEIADEEAIELLNEAAADDDEKVRNRATDALKKAVK